MFFYEGLSCPVCKKPFKSDDDIVACPHCGLPHHRECWKKIGHCYMEDKHDTDEQYSREDALHEKTAQQQAEPVRETTTDPGFNGKICGYCHTKNAEFAEYCTHCGHSLEADDWHSAPSSPHVGEYTPFQSPYAAGQSYTADEQIGSASAQDMAAMVGPNIAYYIPRFRQIEKNGSGGWNWAAFILGPLWLLFRKQYLVGWILLAFQMVANFFASILMLPLVTAETQAAMATAMEQIMQNRLFLPMCLLSVILLAVRIIIGWRGNNLYQRHCLQKIRKIREQTPDLSSAELASKGGTSMVAPMIGYFVPVFVSNIIAVIGMM